jgi:hypothetical protein
MIDYVVIENWYENPDEIRSFALKKFKETKSSGEDKINDDGYAAYPGYRCKSDIKNLLQNKNKIEENSGIKIDPKRWIFMSVCDFQSDLDMLEFDMNLMSMKIKDSDIVLNMSESNSNGCFQYCDENSTMWIHPDHGNTYAAVVYLTPNPPEGTGTGFFKNKKTSQEYQENSEFVLPKEECTNLDNWEMIDYVENVYNRCVIFNAKRFHSATKYFGTTPEDSRLFQVFFFNEK